MAFEVYATETSTGKAGNKPKVDFNQLNKYMVETCQLQQPETLLGVISVIVDLGTQKQSDAQYKLDDEDKGLSIEELEAKYDKEMAKNFEPKDQNYKITKFANAYDSDSKTWQVMKFVKQPDRQSIAYAVDFPDIMVDKGQFFGESKPLPLRLWAGGQFWNQNVGEKGGFVVQNVIPLKKTNIGDDKQKIWSMSTRSALHKMAVAAKLVNAGEAFLPEDVDKLLGKTLQFKAQVYFDKAKNGQEYYTEKVTFAAGLARGQQEKQLDKTYLIQFNQENDPESLKELRKHIVNTIKQATNYQGSVIQKQLDEVRGNYGTTGNVGGNVSDGGSDSGTSNPYVNTPPQQYTESASIVDYDESLPF